MENNNTNLNLFGAILTWGFKYFSRLTMVAADVFCTEYIIINKSDIQKQQTNNNGKQ